MRLLVSVSNGAEAASALAGGADIIDAKDPNRGALGAVTLGALAQIRDACGGRVPLTAALGDRTAEGDVEQSAAAFASAGASLVKIGFADAVSPGAIDAVLRAAMRGVAAAAPEASGVVAVAYADAERVSAAAPHDVLAAAARVGVAGILLDTADKHGPGLRALMSPDALNRWIAASRDAGLIVAIAGKLSAEDIGWLALMDVDIAGVRGAACEGGRTGAISTPRVSMLRARCGAVSPPRAPLRSHPLAAHG